jgi:hypothetical protein
VKTHPYSVMVFAGDSSSSALAKVMPRPCVRVHSHAELVTQANIRPNAVAFVDVHTLPRLDRRQLQIPVVAVLDDTNRILVSSIATLANYPWLSHTLSASALHMSGAKHRLEQFLDRLFEGSEHRVLGEDGVGRIAMLANASRRNERFARMRDFFAGHGLSERTLTTAEEVAEELVMNALYDAPFEAGFFSSAVPRSDNVELPQEHACEISYGVERDEIFVRLRDTFGALTRTRLIEVLSRCSSSAVQLDESRGGAGLGLWRIFSAANTVAITVVEGQVTDIIVSIPAQVKRGVKSLRSVDLKFTPRQPANDWLDSVVLPSDMDAMDQSITLLVRI